MNSMYRQVCRALLLPAVVAVSGTCLTGCPNPPVIADDATITIVNQFSNFNITRVRMIGPGDSAPGANILSETITPGNGVIIGVTAPSVESNPDGVVWTAVVSGTLQLRAKQRDPNDLRPQLNANFNDLDTSDNEELSFEEVVAGFSEVTRYEFDLLDLDNSGFIDLSETGGLLRLATATFTCVHHGDELIWNFDGENAADTCADAP